MLSYPFIYLIVHHVSLQLVCLRFTQIETSVPNLDIISLGATSSDQQKFASLSQLFFLCIFLYFSFTYLDKGMLAKLGEKCNIKILSFVVNVTNGVFPPCHRRSGSTIMSFCPLKPSMLALVEALSTLPTCHLWGHRCDIETSTRRASVSWIW